MGRAWIHGEGQGIEIQGSAPYPLRVRSATIYFSFSLRILKKLILFFRSVNDPFVMKAWAEKMNTNLEDVVFIADFNGSLTKELDLEEDLTHANLGVRSKRYSLLIENGKVVKEFIQDSTPEFDISSADHMLQILGGKE